LVIGNRRKGKIRKISKREEHVEKEEKRKRKEKKKKGKHLLSSPIISHYLTSHLTS
jgi:hypothetical protein